MLPLMPQSTSTGLSSVRETQLALEPSTPLGFVYLSPTHDEEFYLHVWLLQRGGASNIAKSPVIGPVKTNDDDIVPEVAKVPTKDEPFHAGVSALSFPNHGR